jgi:hypothetical protein
MISFAFCWCLSGLNKCFHQYYRILCFPAMVSAIEDLHWSCQRFGLPPRSCKTRHLPRFQGLQHPTGLGMCTCLGSLTNCMIQCCISSHWHPVHVVLSLHLGLHSKAVGFRTSKGWAWRRRNPCLDPSHGHTGLCRTRVHHDRYKLRILFVVLIYMQAEQVWTCKHVDNSTDKSIISSLLFCIRTSDNKERRV